ncbi:MAG TPA: hypothetical protein VKM72_08115, partial [Thermoanaerobaculia bacterium]|nr:hypothetical protein [Thermoanaerobaculia bacterium]
MLVSWCLPLLGIVLPAAVAFYYVFRFGFNVPVYDEWNFMPTVGAFYQGGDWWPMVVEHYGEHRIVLPRLIILYLSRITDLNLVVEEYLSVFFMTLTAVVCWLLLRRTEGCPRWAIVPIGWILLSPAQFENLLVGWQFQIPMMNFFAAAAIYLLSGERRWRGAPAAGCAAAATFSFANGLIIWPAGCIALLASERSTRLRTLAIWLGSAVVTAVAYRWGYHGFDRPPQGYLLTALHKPADATRMFLALYGNNFGQGRIPTSLVAGGVLLALTAAGAFLLWRAGLRRNDAPWLALWSFSTVSVFAVVLGRSFAWESMATPSRFLTVAIFIPVSLVVVLSRAGAVLWRRGLPTRALTATACLLLVGLAVRQGFLTARLGWEMGGAHRGMKESTLPCLLQYRTAPISCLRELYVADGEFVRRNTAILERWHLGPFADAPPATGAAQPARAPVSPGSPPSGVDSMEGSLDFVGVRQPSGESASVRLGEKAIAEGWALTETFE